MSTPNQNQRVDSNQRLRRRALAVGIVLLIVLVASGALLYSSNFRAEQQPVSTNPLMGNTGVIPTCSYEVFVIGGMTTAENCATGVILDQSTNSASVINDAISNSTSGGKIFIKGGTYMFTTASIYMGARIYAAIGTSGGINNIELYGEGNSTILMAGTNLNAAIIGLENVNGWYIHDLEVNGNRANQNGNGRSPNQDGIYLWDSNNIVIERCYIHDEKTYGIAATGHNIKILDNWVVNSNANGISVYTLSNYLIEGNTVNGASDVGIGISGGNSTNPISNVICEGNYITNVNLDVSPWGANTGDGIIVGDNGAANNVTVSNNIINVAYYGVWAGGSTTPITNLIVSDNQIYPTTTCGGFGVCDGISLGQLISYALIQGNIISEGNNGIYTYGSDNGIQILGNLITKMTTPIHFTGTNNGYIIKDNVGYNPVGYISSPISGSTLLDSGSSSTWTSGATYTNWESAKVLYVSGGTVTAIKVDGQTLYTSTTSVSITLQPGDTFSITFSSAPTITVYGQ